MQLLAGASALGFTGLASTAAAARNDVSLWRWRGIALGAQAELTICHRDIAAAERVTRLVLAEIERLEAIFSLYRSESSLVQLNKIGRLETPPMELVNLLSRAQAWSRWTDGAFDVTVQPLWTLYRDHFQRPGAGGDGPSARVLTAAQRLVDYRRLEVHPDHIRLSHPGMAVTLDGIAQGYITDRVADLLRAEGLDRVLVALGEIRGLGTRADGQPWQVGLAPTERAGEPPETVALRNQAVATSEAAGLRFDGVGQYHHLIDPRSGDSARGFHSVSVVAERACDADALSTALMVAGRSCLSDAAMRELGVTRITAVDANQVVYRLL